MSTFWKMGERGGEAISISDERPLARRRLRPSSQVLQRLYLHGRSRRSHPQHATHHLFPKTDQSARTPRSAASQILKPGTGRWSSSFPRLYSWRTSIAASARRT